MTTKNRNQSPAHEDIFNAEHPHRKAAINLIEAVIEPLLDRGIEGEEYYELEDKITLLINRELDQSDNAKKTITIEIDRGCLTDVHGLPTGWTYTLVDHDEEHRP